MVSSSTICCFFTVYQGYPLISLTRCQTSKPICFTKPVIGFVIAVVVGFVIAAVVVAVVYVAVDVVAG